jgi:thiol-disulfide isomerase/thioredoxin
MKFLTLLLPLVLIVNIGIAQTTVVKFDHIEKLLNDKSSDKILVINFWATWCAPCVKEIPLFETFQANNKETVVVKLFSLDYADKVDKVNAFVKRKQLKCEVFLLDEIDGNSWIDKVDPTWGGAIPATIIINPKTGHRKFIEKELKDGDLERLVNEISLNN